jgi:hypothetical protein
MIMYVYTGCPRKNGHNIGHSKQKVYVYMCSIPNGFPDRPISLYSNFNLAPNIGLPSHMWNSVKRQLAVVTVDSDIVGVLWKMPHIFINTEYAGLTRVAKCIVIDGKFSKVYYTR